MAIAKRFDNIHTAEVSLGKRIRIEKEFAQQAYVTFREIKFGITPCCYVNYESSVIAHSIQSWKDSSSDKIVVATGSAGIFLEPLADINSEASAVCPVTPSNVCTIIDIASLVKTGGAYTQCFDSPLAVWTVTHNLSKFPSVTVVDTNNNLVVGNVNYINNNSIQITFSTAFKGCVFLN
jgi:hypothetical protein